MTHLVLFSTPSCGQCPQQADILREIAADRDDVTFEKVDATESVERANKYGVRSVPSTVILDDEDTVISKVDGLTQADDITAKL